MCISRSFSVGLGVSVVLLMALTVGAAPVGTSFTYQGKLTDTSVPANGVYDFEFALYDDASAGSQVGTTIAMEDVPVANGIFVVALDFGSGAFTGDARWLEIGVRPGAETGAFTTLTSRQELTPTPNAIHAEDATTVGGLSCADGQVPKWSSGVWSCAADIDTDTNSGGTVTNVATGAGLTGGPVTTTGTISVADGGITSAKIATGAVGLAQINTSQVQARVSTSCPAGQYLKGISADGTVLCQSLFGTTMTTVDAPANTVGFDASMAIGADGFPVISYWDVTAGALKVAKCGNAACSGGNCATTVDDPANSVGLYSSIAIGADRFPIISYHDETGTALKVAKCGDQLCIGPTTITTLDDDMGWLTSIAIGADGRPVISYFGSAGALKVAKCSNAACTATSSITVVDSPGVVAGQRPAMAIGTDGFPVISYHHVSQMALRVAKCGSAACTSGNTITTVDLPWVGLYSSIAIGADGLPIISNVDYVNNLLKAVKCGNAACSSGNTITTVGSLVNASWDTSIAIGTDGLPIIAYTDTQAWSLKVAKCGNAACTGSSLITTVDSSSIVYQRPSIAIGADSLPVVSYCCANTLKVAKCGTRTCQ
jgi:hypothetical protein